MTFAHPAWLLLIALLPLLGIAALLLAGTRAKRWRVMVSERLSGSLLLSTNPVPRWIALLFLLGACACLLTAFARPQGDGGTTQETLSGRNLLIALDLSRSMRAADVKPDRLSAAKLMIYEMLDAMPDDRIGLIGFGGSAYLYAPLTVDHQAVRETVEQMDENWPTIGGSDLCAAAKLGIETLRKTGLKNNALVIISDGEKHGGDLTSVIDAAKRNGVFILTIGVGTEDGTTIPHPDFPGERMVNRDGSPVISRLRAENLRELAVRTNGSYTSANSGAELPTIIQASLAKLEAAEIKGKERRLIIEFFPWFTLPAILFLIISMVLNTRWRPVRTALPAATLLAFLALTPNSRADDAKEAAKALAANDHQRARTLYQNLARETWFEDRKAAFHFGEATAAYRSQSFKDASKAYSQALLSKDPSLQANAHLGMGNSLFQIGWMELTGKPYPGDPKKIPTLEQFDQLASTYIDKLRDQLAETPEEELPAENKPLYPQLDELIMNWSDAIRHFDSAHQQSQSLTEATHNRRTTLVYMERLLKTLNDKERETEQMIPPPEPKDPKGSGDEPKDSEKPEEPKDDPQKQPGDNPQDQGQSDPKQDPKDPGNPKQDPKDPKEPNQKPEKDPKNAGENDKGQKPQARPDETPEERARRILKENSDCEKGPLTPGFREFNNPEKDW